MKHILLYFALFLPLLGRESPPIVIAHRGASGYLPEHTLAAKAMAHAQGAEFLEQDIVLTKDDVPVVLHDIHLDTTTDVATCFPERKRADGRYYTLDFTVAELKQLRVTERFNAKTSQAVYPNRFPVGGAPFQISTLEEELKFIQGLNKSSGRVAGIYPEIKQPAWHRKQGHDISSIVISILRRCGYVTREDPCWLQCFEFEEVKRLRTELDWEGRLLLLGDEFLLPKGLTKVAKFADGIGPPISSVISGKNPADRRVTELVKNAHAIDLVVHPYTLRVDELPGVARSVDDLLSLLFTEAGVDGLFTDFPDVVVKWLEQSDE